MTPTIPTSRLVLRPLAKATQRQVDWLRDPKVVEFSEQRHRVHSLSSQLRYIEGLPKGSHMWGIFHVADDRHIGNLTATADEPNNIADIGILIGDRDLWGKGFATEAWKAAADWLLDTNGGNLRKLEAGTMAPNLAMRRVLFHTGFQLESERKNHFLWNGQLTGALYYGKFR